MAYDVDRRPGAWVSRQAVRRERRFWLTALVYFAIALLMLTLALDHRVSAVTSLFYLGLVLVAWPVGNRARDEMLGWLRGAKAEESVGETLNELRGEGWVLMHDIVQRGEGNIDHLAWGPEQGVYLIETKLRRYEDGQLVKVKRQAGKLHDELGSWVTPVICLHQRRGAPFRSHGVWVVPQQHLLDWLRRQRNQLVPFERLARFADGVEPEDA